MENQHIFKPENLPKGTTSSFLLACYDEEGNQIPVPTFESENQPVDDGFWWIPYEGEI